MFEGQENSPPGNEHQDIVSTLVNNLELRRAPTTVIGVFGLLNSNPILDGAPSQQSVPNVSISFSSEEIAINNSSDFSTNDFSQRDPLVEVAISEDINGTDNEVSQLSSFRFQPISNNLNGASSMINTPLPINDLVHLPDFVPLIFLNFEAIAHVNENEQDNLSEGETTLADNNTDTDLEEDDDDDDMEVVFLVENISNIDPNTFFPSSTNFNQHPEDDNV
jgi:hypothetical protein